MVNADTAAAMPRPGISNTLQQTGAWLPFCQVSSLSNSTLPAMCVLDLSAWPMGHEHCLLSIKTVVSQSCQAVLHLLQICMFTAVEKVRSGVTRYHIRMEEDHPLFHAMTF